MWIYWFMITIISVIIFMNFTIALINDSYQDFGAGQFIWRAGDPAVEGYVVASDSRRDGLAAGF